MNRQVMKILTLLMGEDKPKPIVYPEFIQYLITNYPEKQDEILYSWSQYPEVQYGDKSYIYGDRIYMDTGIKFNVQHTYMGEFFTDVNDKCYFGAFESWSAGGVAQFWYEQPNIRVHCRNGSSNKVGDFSFDNDSIVKLSIHNGTFTINGVVVFTETTKTAIDRNFMLGIHKDGNYPFNAKGYSGNIKNIIILDAEGKLLKYYVPISQGLLDIVNCELGTINVGSQGGSWEYIDYIRKSTYTYENGCIIDGTTVVGSQKNTENVVIPDYITKIGSQAFNNDVTLKSVTIPNSVTSIENNAFNGCSGLTSITIPNSVTSIGNSAFKGCYGLTSVTIPNSVTSIGADAFYGCTGLTSVTIPNSVTIIENNAFNGCSGLTSVTIPNSVTIIGNSAFRNCTGLTSITIPNSVTSIGNSAFNGCSGLTSVTIPNSVTSIGNCAFYGCYGLTSVTIPNSVETIEAYTISMYPDSSNNITEIIFPDSVLTIGRGVCEFNTGLIKVTIGKNISEMGRSIDSFSDGRLFYQCPLEEIHFRSTTPPTILGSVTGGDGNFNAITSTCKIYVPVGCLDAYKSASNYPDPTKYEYIEEEIV